MFFHLKQIKKLMYINDYSSSIASYLSRYLGAKILKQLHNEVSMAKRRPYVKLIKLIQQKLTGVCTHSENSILHCITLCVLAIE